MSRHTRHFQQSCSDTSRSTKSGASTHLTVASDARLIFVTLLTAVLSIAHGRSARALTFHLTYDSSASTAPPAFLPAFNDALQFYESNFIDPITINLQVGWGTINNQSLLPGAVGESFTNGQVFSNFAGVKAALTSDAKSVADFLSVANMPAGDPTGAATFTMSDAEGKALGLLGANAPAIDGYVGFNSSSPFTFDPNNRGVAGKNDFIGAAEHEISEVMGRYGLGQNGRKTGRYSPIDFFRYLSPGTLDLAPAYGAYFSIDGGATVINTFNGPNGGDLSDWSGATVDSYNTGTNLGEESPVSVGDITVMDVIGYDAAVSHLPGDYNANGVVDAADFVVWRKGLGTTYVQSDYDVWRSHFGQTLASGAGALANSAVPEPSTAAMLILGILLMHARGCLRFRRPADAPRIRYVGRWLVNQITPMHGLRRLVVLSMLLSVAPAASAQLTFNITNNGTASSQMMTAFAQAGALWSAYLKDPITINIRVGSASLSAGVIGHSDIFYDSYGYANVRSAMVNDRLSLDDFSSIDTLQPGPAFSMLINRTANNPDGVVSLTPYFDTGLGGPGQAGPENNSTVRMPAANAKALGLSSYDPTLLDGITTVTNSAIFDFDRSNGIAANKIDFVGVAAHEIGHVLGFTSGVDVLVGNGAPPGLNDNQLKFVTPLDLLRFTSRSIGAGGGTGVIDWTGDDTDKYFSVDGGLTPLANFSHGTTYEEDHWQSNAGIGIMDPSAIAGQLLKISEMDARALDVIGYNRVAASLAGDFNFNGVVDAADYVAWRKANGTHASFDIWRAHFGQNAGNSAAAGATAFVPEPGTLILLIFSANSEWIRRRRSTYKSQQLVNA